MPKLSPNFSDLKPYRTGKIEQSPPARIECNGSRVNGERCGRSATVIAIYKNPPEIAAAMGGKASTEVYFCNACSFERLGKDSPADFGDAMRTIVFEPRKGNK